MINPSLCQFTAGSNRSAHSRSFNRAVLGRLPLFLIATFVFLHMQSVVSQDVESTKDKVTHIRGVDFKKNLVRVADGNSNFQITMENKTNETMVVDLGFEFSNSEISESVQEAYHLEPAETKVGSFTSKFRNIKENAVVTVQITKQLVRTVREVAEETQLREEKAKREQAQKAAADFARQQKAGEDWQKQMAALAEANRRAAQNKPVAPAEPVKFDVELVKLLLLDMEGRKPKPDLNSFSKPAMNHHWGLMIDAGLVDGAAIKGADGAVNSVMLKRLTKEGRDFLAAARIESAWKQVTHQATEEGDKMTLARLKQLVAESARPGPK